MAEGAGWIYFAVAGLVALLTVMAGFSLFRPDDDEGYARGRGFARILAFPLLILLLIAAVLFFLNGAALGPVPLWALFLGLALLLLALVWRYGLALTGLAFLLVLLALLLSSGPWRLSWPPLLQGHPLCEIPVVSGLLCEKETASRLADVDDDQPEEPDAPAPGSAPVLAAIPDQETQAGMFVSFFASAEDADGDPVFFTFEGQPPGVSIDETTGEIAGAPELAGVYEAVTVVADDRKDGLDAAVFTWVITEAPAPVEEETFNASGVFLNDKASFDGAPEQSFKDALSQACAFGAVTSVVIETGCAPEEARCVADALAERRAQRIENILRADPTCLPTELDVVQDTRALSSARASVAITARREP